MKVHLNPSAKFFLGVALFLAPLAVSTPALAWMMAYSETQRSMSLGLEEAANDPDSPMHINGISADTKVYQGWRTDVLPEGLKPLVIAERQGTDNAGFAGLVDQKELNLTDLDVAVAGHLLATRVDTRSRFDMPVMQDVTRPPQAAGIVYTTGQMIALGHSLASAINNMDVTAVVNRQGPGHLPVYGHSYDIPGPNWPRSNVKAKQLNTLISGP